MLKLSDSVQKTIMLTICKGIQKYLQEAKKYKTNKTNMTNNQIKLQELKNTEVENKLTKDGFNIR